MRNFCAFLAISLSLSAFPVLPPKAWAKDEVQVADVLKRMQIELYARKGLEALLGQLNRLLPFEKSAHGLMGHGGWRELLDHVRTNKCDTNPICPSFSYPVGTWSGFLNNARVQLRRDLVAGRVFDGASDQVSLVDTVAVEFQVGYFYGSSELTSLIGSFGTHLGARREWVHVTPLARAQDVAKDPDFKGLAPLAIRKLKQSVAQAIEGAIAPEAGAIAHLAPGEAYMTTDKLGYAMGARFVAPLAEIGLPGASIGLTVSKSHVTLRKDVILRNDSEAQVYLTRARADAMSAKLDATYFTRLLSFGVERKRGKAETLMYRLPLDSSERTAAATRAIHHVLKGEPGALAGEGLSPTLLTHDVRTKKIEQRFLFWARQKVEQNHRVTLNLPGRAEPVNLQSNRRYRLKSKSWLTPLRDAYDLIKDERLDMVEDDDIRVPMEEDEEEGLPSAYSTTTTEAEIAADGSPQGMITVVEDVHRASKLSRDGLYSAIGPMQSLVSPPDLDAKGLVRAEIRSRLSISPAGFAALTEQLVPAPGRGADGPILQRLIGLWGPARYAKFRDRSAALRRAMNARGEAPSPGVYRTREGKLVYAPSWMQELLRLRKDKSKNADQSIRRQTRIVELVLRNLGAHAVRGLLGQRGQAYGYDLSIEGILEGGNSDGYRFSWAGGDRSSGLQGAFRQWMARHRITEYELRAKYLSLK